MDDDVALLLAEQADQIARLQTEMTQLHGDAGTLSERLDLATRQLNGAAKRDPGEYWSGVYDRAFDAWNAFALAELGTMTPSVLDLRGRPELLALYEALK